MSGCLRHARIDDFEDVAKIATELQNMHAKIRPDIYVKVKNYLEEYEFKEYLKENRFIIYKDENEIKGIAIISVKNDENGKTLSIDGLGIKETQQHKGYGERFFQGIKLLAKRKKCNKIELEVVKSNENAVKFYKAMGMNFYNDNTMVIYIT